MENHIEMDIEEDETTLVISQDPFKSRPLTKKIPLRRAGTVTVDLNTKKIKRTV
jgi:hypothetical protein